MSKKIVFTAIAVILGTAVLTMITATVSFVFEAITTNDIANISKVGEDMETFISYVKSTAIGVSVFSVAALASYCFAYFSKVKKLFNCIAAGLSFALAVFCIAFVFDLRRIVLDIASGSIYTAATSYFSELIAIAVAALILCACFTVATVKAFTAKDNGIKVKEEENDETL